MNAQMITHLGYVCEWEREQSLLTSFLIHSPGSFKNEMAWDGIKATSCRVLMEEGHMLTLHGLWWACRPSLRATVPRTLHGSLPGNHRSRYNLVCSLASEPLIASLPLSLGRSLKWCPGSLVRLPWIEEWQEQWNFMFPKFDSYNALFRLLTPHAADLESLKMFSMYWLTCKEVFFTVFLRGMEWNIGCLLHSILLPSSELATVWCFGSPQRRLVFRSFSQVNSRSTRSLASVIGTDLHRLFKWDESGRADRRRGKETSLNKECTRQQIL